MKLTKLTLGALITASLFTMAGCQSNSNSTSSANSSSSSRTSKILTKKSSSSQKNSVETNESSESSSESSQASQSSSSKVVEKKETMPTASELMANVAQFKNAKFTIEEKTKDEGENIVGSLQENPDLVHYVMTDYEAWAGDEYVYYKMGHEGKWTKMKQTNKNGIYYPLTRNIPETAIKAMKVTKSGDTYVATYDGNDQDVSDKIRGLVGKSQGVVDPWNQDADNIKLVYEFNANKQLTAMKINYTAGANTGSFKYTDVNALPTLSVPQSIIKSAKNIGEEDDE